MKQSEAISILEQGNNVFLTGEAGSGKTFVLRKFIAQQKQAKKNVAVTASTGIAATHLGGRTIHSWSGMGIADTYSPRIVKKMNDSKLDAIQSADVLVIDEISLLSSSQIDCVDKILRTVREDSSPFGGVQVVLCGDLFQLPPVVRRDEQKEVFLAHHSQIFKDRLLEVCYLTEQYRQDDTDPLHGLLAEIRKGEITEYGEGIINQLLERSRSPGVISGENIVAKLFPFNAAVDGINAKELSRLPGEPKTFSLTTSGDRIALEALIKGSIALEELVLKIGAPVMFIKNDQKGRYVNGTQGVVHSFDKKSGYPIIETQESMIKTAPDTWEIEDVESDGALAAFSQIPLRLAWSITIHKSQGMTLDSVEIDLSRCFSPGMGYVALSRVRSLDGLVLKGINNVALSVNQQALEADALLREMSKSAQIAISKA